MEAPSSELAPGRRRPGGTDAAGWLGSDVCTRLGKAGRATAPERGPAPSPLRLSLRGSRGERDLQRDLQRDPEQDL
jgi:hypothetical protein